jgi:epi-isozizaene synthase
MSVSSAELALPVVETDFPRRLDPYWPLVRDSAHEWLLHSRLMSSEVVRNHADDLRYTDLVAGYYVGGPAMVLSAIVDFSGWFFVWDDRHDRDISHRRDDAWARRSDALHAAVENPHAHLGHPDPLVAAFSDAVSRLYSFLSDRWNARFAGHFHPVIDAYDQEFHNRVTGTVPTVAEYVELRRHTFGHWVWLDLLELTAQHELPRQVRDSDAYRRAGLASQDFSAWYNDLCSLPKELAAADVHNLGISLIHHDGLTMPQAVAEVHRRVSARVTDFREAEEDVLRLLAKPGMAPQLRDAVRSCLFNMRNWISSVYWFHHESGRYRVKAWDDPSLPPYVNDLAVHDDRGHSTADSRPRRRRQAGSWPRLAPPA